MRGVTSGVVVGDVPKLVPQDPRYGTHAGDVVLVADTVGKQSIPDFPRKYPRVFLLELPNIRYDLGGSDPRFRPSDGSRENGTGFVVAC